MKLRDKTLFSPRDFPVVFGLLASAMLAGAAENMEFFSFQRLTNREMILQVTAPTGLNYRVDVSTNLTSWVSLVSFPLTNTSFQHLDSAAPFQPRRFYSGRQLAETNLITGDHLATTNGDLVIRTLAHASVVMSWSNLAIYVDVTNQARVGPPADLFLLTHGHTDHLNPTAISAAIHSNGVIIASQWAWSNLTANLKTITTVITNGTAITVRGVGIEAVPMYNLTAANHPLAAKGSGFILTLGGKRIYLSGDTDNTPELRALSNIDVAFVAMRGSPANMNIADAVSAVRTFRPLVVYPYHYVNNDPNSFKQQLGTDLGIEVRLRKWY